MKEFDRSKVLENAQNGKKKAIIIAISVCVVLILILACIVLVYKQIEAKTFKLYINGQRVTTSEDFMITDSNGNYYIKAKELAGLIGWSYQNGEYGSYTEDINSGYFQNEYEASSFKSGSTKLKKYIQVSEALDTDNFNSKNTNTTNTNTTNNNQYANINIEVSSPNGTLESMDMTLPVITSNNQVYIPFSHVNDICNCLGTYENFKMDIYEQNYLMAIATQNAAKFGYNSVSEIYENMRTLAYGMMVVNKNDIYGVVSLFSGDQILGFKYSDIKFNQNVKEFFVKGTGSDRDTVGLISVEGTVIISPKAYDNISVLSDELGLYLIEKNGKYGVLNRQGDVIVYDEFDSIGLPEELLDEYGYTSEDNKYLIYNSAIVVESDGYYGLYNLEGKEILPVTYQGLGCNVNASLSKVNENSDDDENESSSSSTRKNRDEGMKSVLTMEAEIELDNGDIGIVKGIVIENDNFGTPGYGIYDLVSKKIIIPCICERMYSKTRSGVVTNYMEFNEEEFEFVSYVEQYQLYTVNSGN